MTNLEEVLKNFDQRLILIEKQLGELIKPTTNQISFIKQVENLQVTPTNQSYDSNNKYEEDNSKPFDSASMLAFIGIIFVILAGIFFIKISIDSGWLTPFRQILLAAGTGLTLFFIPQYFPNAEKEYGAVLAGAGTTILHITWFGAYFLHHVIDADVALICATLVGIFSILANFDKGNRLYVLVAMAGTYLSAPIIGYNTEELSNLSIFLIIWNISFSVTSLMNKRREIMFIASYYAVFTVLLLSGNAHSAEQQTELLVLQLVQFIIFSSAMFSYSVYHKKPLSTDESVAVLPLLLLFYFSTGRLISIINPGFAPWFGIAIGIFVLTIYFVAKTFLSDELKSTSTLTAFAAVAFVHSIYFQLLNECWQPLAALLIVLVLMIIWYQNIIVRKTFLWPFIVLLSTFVYGTILTIVSSIESMFCYNWAYGIVILSAVLRTASIKGSNTKEPIKYSTMLLGFGHFEVMLGLYRFSQHISWSGVLFVTITWGIYALIVLGIAYWRRDKTLGHSALTILMAVGLKAFFYDVNNTNHLIRVECLLGEGMLLYFCGWIFKKMQKWKTI